MTGTDTGSHDKANGAFFPLVHGMELRRVQQRFLASLLRQPDLVPTVLTTGIVPEDFPEEWRPAFIIATKAHRARPIVAEAQRRSPTIPPTYIRVRLFCWDMARPGKWRSRLSPVFDGAKPPVSRRSPSYRLQQFERP